MKLEEVIARSLETSRLKEELLSSQARQISLVAGHLLETLRAGRTVHVVGEGPLLHISRYVAESMHRPGGQRVLPARCLGEQLGDDGWSRAVEAFVRSGEVLLLLSHVPSPRLERAASLARARKARAVGILGRPARTLVEGCDVGILIPSDDPSLVAEGVLSTVHVLQGLVLQGLGEPARVQPQVPRPASDTGPAPTSFSDLGVIVRDSDSELDAISREGDLLAEAVEMGLNPPTDPRGVVRRPPPIDVASYRIRCPSCAEVIHVDVKHAGRKGQCPSCYCKFRIPQPDGSREPQAVSLDVVYAAPPTDPTPTRRTRRTRRERRRSSRFTVKDALVRFSTEAYPDGRGYLEAHTLEDLSLTGLRFIGRASGVKIGDIAFFAVDFPAFPMPVRFKGEVRRLIPVDGGHAVGIRFLEYVGDAESKIRRLLEQEHLRGVRRR